MGRVVQCLGRLPAWAWVGATWLAGALVFFREQWTSGFRWLMGNDGDTRFAAYVCEHWFRVLHGQASWLNPSFFYPVKGVLGWSETFFLYEVLYAPFRELGCDPFLALQLTVIGFSLIGFVCFVYLVRIAFGTPLLAALICGLIFAFPNALWIHSSSAQLSGVYLVPAVALLGVQACKQRQRHPARSTALAGACGGMWALLLYSSFYVAWFATVSLAAVAILLFFTGPRWSLTRAVVSLGEGWRLLAVACVGFGLGILPFLRTFLPADRPYTYTAVIHYSGRWQDLINVGTSNLVWGRVVRQVVPVAYRAPYELSYAVTPVVMGLAVLGGALALSRAWSKAPGSSLTRRLAGSLAGAAVFASFLPLKTRFGTLWAVVWHVPGASAIRAIDRVEVISLLLAVLAISAAAAELRAWVPAGRWRPPVYALAGLLLVLGVLEQVNTGDFSRVNRPLDARLIRSVGHPPASCRAFFVVDTERPLPYYDYQLDAMLASEEVSVPTINGYSGLFPDGWQLLQPWRPTYLAGVRQWASAHDLKALCELDLASMEWQFPPDRAVSIRVHV